MVKGIFSKNHAIKGKEDLHGYVVKQSAITYSHFADSNHIDDGSID